MDTKHTPGPWHVEVESTFPFALSVVSAAGSTLMHQDRFGFSSRQETLDDVMSGRFMGSDREEAVRCNALQVANLNLIAAATELLVALESIERVAKSKGMTDADRKAAMRDIAEHASAAIRKACKGR